MKKELLLLLFLLLIILASEVFSQNETISEENNTTTLEDNNTLTSEENKTEVMKTLLSDCTKICPNKDGCTCPQDCEKKETNHSFDCGKKIPVKTSQPIVSLCEGCLTDDTNNPCLEVGNQKQEADGTTFYCSSSKKLEMAKEAGENCNNDYECLDYTCSEGVCFEELEEENGLKTSQTLLITGAVILFGVLTLLAFKLLNTKKTVVKEEKKTEKKGFEVQEPKQKYSYKYRPEFDVLEKKLKESLNPKK